MHPPQAEIRAYELRRRELLAESARERLAATARGSASPRIATTLEKQCGRPRSKLAVTHPRYALASLALAFGLGGH